MKKIYFSPALNFANMTAQDAITASGELPANYASDPYLSDLDWYIPTSNS